MKTKRHFKGLTLIELMVAVTLLATLLLLSAPSISGYLEDRRVRNVAESLFYGMQQARLLAVDENIHAQFEWDGNTGWTIWRINMLTRAREATSVDTFDWAHWPSVSVTATGAPVTVVTFSGMGRVLFPDDDPAVTTPPTQFDVSGRPGSRALRVVVGGTSGVRVCDPAFPPGTDRKACPA